MILLLLKLLKSLTKQLQQTNSLKERNGSLYVDSYRLFYLEYFEGIVVKTTSNQMKIIIFAC